MVLGSGPSSSGPSSVQSYGSTRSSASTQSSILIDGAGRIRSKEENVRHEESDNSMNSTSREDEGHDMR